MLRPSRSKDFWWSREDTLLLISQYREHEKLFRNANYKMKSVWELITASIAAENAAGRGKVGIIDTRHLSEPAVFLA